MTKDEALHLSKVLKAYAEGKTIQMKDNGAWFDFTGEVAIMFNCKPFNYRIKPSVRYMRYIGLIGPREQIYCHNENESITVVGREKLRYFVRWIDEDWIEQEL